MHFDRSSLKSHAKDDFKRNYSASVIAAWVMILVAGITLNVGLDNGSTSVLAQIDLSLIAGIAVLGFLLEVFVVNPLKVGGFTFFLKNSHEKAKISELISGFKNNFSNIVVAMFLKDIFTCLWTLLFVIPGIVKAYSYSMVPFILAENPELQPMEAIAKSKEMMDGYKWQTFVLDLSFIGWEILSACTLGLVGLLYANPYYFQTKAELYECLKSFG